MKKIPHSFVSKINFSSKENIKNEYKVIYKTLVQKDIEVNGGIPTQYGGKLVLRNVRYGQFKGCNNFSK